MNSLISLNGMHPATADNIEFQHQAHVSPFKIHCQQQLRLYSSTLQSLSSKINATHHSPQRAAHRISELNLFLYLRISGVSEPTSCDVGVTFTFTCDSRRVGPEPPAPNPKVRNERCFCWSGWVGNLETAWRYCNPNKWSSVQHINGEKRQKGKSTYIS